jgi:hypothetical protein
MSGCAFPCEVPARFVDLTEFCGVVLRSGGRHLGVLEGYRMDNRRVGRSIL